MEKAPKETRAFEILLHEDHGAQELDVPGVWRCTTHSPPHTFRLRVKSDALTKKASVRGVTDRESLQRLFKRNKGSQRSRQVLIHSSDKTAQHKKGFFVDADTFERVTE